MVSLCKRHDVHRVTDRHPVVRVVGLPAFACLLSRAITSSRSRVLALQATRVSRASCNDPLCLHSHNAHLCPPRCMNIHPQDELHCDKEDVVAVLKALLEGRAASDRTNRPLAHLLAAPTTYTRTLHRTASAWTPSPHTYSLVGKQDRVLAHLHEKRKVAWAKSLASNKQQNKQNLLVGSRKVAQQGSRISSYEQDVAVVLHTLFKSRSSRQLPSLHVALQPHTFTRLDCCASCSFVRSAAALVSPRLLRALQQQQLARFCSSARRRRRRQHI